MNRRPWLFLQDAAFAAHGFGDENAANARRPDHAGRMELDELHVHEIGSGVVGERVTVAGVLPAVARDLVGAADAAGRQDDRLGPEQLEPAALALVAERADDAIAVLEQLDDRALHVHVDALVDPVILQRANHLETGAIADVGQARIPVAAEVALENLSVLGPIEHRAPRFELAHAIGRLLRVQLRHAPVVDVLAAAHRVREMDLPVVAIVDVGERGGDAAFGHHRVRLAEQRLAHEPDGHAASRGFDCRSQPRSTCADDEDIVLVCLILRHHQILKSDHTPMEQSRTYRSAKPTVNRLHHAHNMCLRFRQLTQEYALTPMCERDNSSTQPPTT